MFKQGTNSIITKKQLFSYLQLGKSASLKSTIHRMILPAGIFECFSFA